MIQIDVTPSELYAQRTRLFDALESAFPVRFRVAGNGKPDATLAFVTGTPDPQAMSGPTLWLVEQPISNGDQRFGAISFRESPLLPKPFRGRTLKESLTPGRALPRVFEAWGDVLATCSEGPVWSGRAGLQYAAASWPAEPASGETLREQLTAGRFMGLLPLAHFLGQLSAHVSWEPPESKACFVFDDPNLHWWSYGFLDYRKLSAHAEAHDYHVTAATIPLDQWYIHRATAEFLRKQLRISFAIHGNNHTREELRRVDKLDLASTLAAQALQRASAIRRAGVDIAPVMVPPHGVCSIATLEGCLRAGFDALCADWPYWWLTEPKSVTTLSGWRPLDRLGGLPVIPRLHVVASDLDDVVFRAFLGQPLILYAHHTDLRAGLDLLAARADYVRSLGVNSWQSLGRIADDVVSTYRCGDCVTITLYSRRAVFAIPEGVAHVQFVITGSDPSETVLRVEIRDAGGLREIRLGERVPVKVGAIVATVTAESSIAPPRSKWPVRAAVRRVLTEGRDRAAPLAGRIGSRGWATRDGR